MNVVKAINQEEFQGFSFINPDYGKMSYCPTSDIHWPLLFLKKKCDFFSLVPLHKLLWKKKNKQKKVTRYQDYRNEEEFIGKGREENILLKEHHIFSSLFQTTYFMSVNNIWVDTDEPIFPYIPAICCGVSPVL